MRRYGYILLFLAILVVPLLAHAIHGRQSRNLSDTSEDKLVIITPHLQEIRDEFRWAFADWHQRKYGRPVELEFLTPGGTTDIRRQLDTIYRAIRDAHGGALPPEDQINTGIDMVWGGGDYEFNSKLKPLGILHPLELDPRLLKEVFPEPTLAGVKLYDQDKDKSGNPLPPRWIGVCLSSFGIIYNPDLYRSLNLPFPRTWTDLTDPRLFAMLSMADPSHSGSAATTYMMVIQRSMADAEIEFIHRPQNAGMPLAKLKSTPAYAQTLDAGWKQGMRQLLLIAANVRFFSDSSSQPPDDVARGDAAAGMAIDFYGRVTEQIVGSDRETFIAPRGATAINPDPIAILYGTHGKQLELANHFIEFLFSPEGQKLWILKTGQPSGPRTVALRRLPIRQSVYADRTGWTDDVNYFETANGFNQHNEWMGTYAELPQIWAAGWIDARDDLQQACKQILAVPDEQKRAALLAELSDIPITRPEVTAEIAAANRIIADHSQDPDVWKARQRLNWAKRFAEHYRQVAAKRKEIETFSMKARTTHRLISLGLYAFFALFFLWPISRILVRGFETRDKHFTFQYVELIFGDPQLVRGLFNAIAIAAVVTLLCLIIAAPLAILSVRFEFPGRGWLSGMMLAPLVLPPFVGAIGVRLLLGRLGPLSVLLGLGHGAGFDWLGRYRAAGIILVEALHLYPILLLNLQASLASIDPTMEQAAANLGASRLTIFRRITLPLIRPGIFAGCTLTLIWSFTELGTPLMFGFSTITPVQIFEQITDVADNPLPFALVVVTLGVAVALYLIGKVFLGRSYDSAASKASVAMTPKRLRGWQALAACLPFVFVLALALLPHLSVILTSISATGQWYRSILPQHFTSAHYLAALTDDLAMPSIANSVIYASLATLVALAVGLGVGIIAVRSRLPDRGFIDALAMLPLAVPGLVLAFGYLAISVALKQKFGEKLPIWLNVQEMPVVFLIIAYAARRLPYIVRSTVAGLQQTPVDLELAAANLGARRATVLRRITLPLILANLIAGSLLAFAFALLEVGDSIILAQKEAYYPITRAILELSLRLGDGVYIASALGVWAMLLLTITLLAANQLLGRKMGAVFRI